MLEEEEVAFGFEYPSGLPHCVFGMRDGAQAEGDDNSVELGVGERKRFCIGPQQADRTGGIRGAAAGSLEHRWVRVDRDHLLRALVEGKAQPSPGCDFEHATSCLASHALALAAKAHPFLRPHVGVVEGGDDRVLELH